MTERSDPPPERDNQPSQHPRQHPPVENPDDPEAQDPGQQFPVENQPAVPENRAEQQE